MPAQRHPGERTSPARVIVVHVPGHVAIRHQEVGLVTIDLAETCVMPLRLLRSMPD